MVTVMKIEYLRKVSLEIEIDGNPVRGVTSTRESEPLHFIFGVASGGLSPFEQAIHYKSSGDQVKLSVEAESAPSYFGHIYKQLCSQMVLGIIPESFDITFTITDVKKSEEKEVVQALAQSVGHGCGGGGCDCGCS